MITVFLHNLEAVFGWILAASWQASVLVVLVLLVQRTLGERLNPRWRYTLWLLVVLRLVLPALPESALSLFQFAPPPPASVVVSITEPLSLSNPLPLPPAEMPPVEPGYAFSLYSLLAVGWLLGAIVLLILTWQVNRRFARQVANSPEITDPELLRLFATAKTELSIHREIRLIENGQVQSPAIMGLFQPTLLLPADVRGKFDACELRYIFLHELAHLKRGDVIVQALIALLQIIHWFNPVLWFAFRRMRIDREPATDALVLSRTGEAEKERYGLMLLKLLEHFNQRHSIPTLVGILEDKDQFKRRFSLIAKFTRGAYGWSLLGILLIGGLAAICLTKAKSSEPTTQADPSMSEAEAKEKGIAALVNGKPVYWADIIYDRSSSGDTPSPKQSAQELQRWAHDAIEIELIVQANDTSKDPFVPDIQKIIDFGVKGFGGDKNAFAENLKKNGTTLERFTEMSRKQAIANHALTDFYKQHKNSTSTSPLTEEERKKELANGYTDMMRQEDEWVRNMYTKATIQLFAIPESLTQTSTASDTGKTSADTVSVAGIAIQGDTNATDAEAMQKGDTATVQKLIDQGASPKAVAGLAIPPDLATAQQDLLAAKEDANARHVLAAKTEKLSDEQLVGILQALGRSDPQVAALQIEIDDQNGDIEGLLKDGFTEDHPRIQALRAEVTVKQQRMKDLIDGLRRALAVDAQTGDSRVALLTKTVNDLTAASGGTTPPASATVPVAVELAFRQKQLLAAQEDADSRRVLLNNVKNLPDEKLVGTLQGLGRGDPAIAALQTDIDNQKANIENLLKSGYDENHPRVVTLRAGLAVKQQRMKELIDGLRRAMAIDSQMADSRVALLTRVETDLKVAPTGVQPEVAVTQATEIPSPPGNTGLVQIGLKMVEIDDDVYSANKEKVDAAVARGDLLFFHNLKGASLLDAPRVSTKMGERCAIEMVQEFAYATSFDYPRVANIVQYDGSTNAVNLPITPREFTRQDVGVKAELTPSLDHNKFIVNGKLSVTDFTGFTRSNLGAQMPSFQTNESLFLEALDNNQEKGFWIPGVRNREQIFEGNGATAKAPSKATRLILFVSAKQSE